MTLEHHATFAAVRDEWDELAGAVDAQPFLRAGWFAAWWRAFGCGSLDIVALRRDGRLAAVLPLNRRRGIVRSLSNWHQPEFGAVAQDRAARRALADTLLRTSRSPLVLRLVDGHGEDAEALRAAGQPAPARLQTRVQLQAPFLDIDGDWDGYRRRLDKKFYAELRRRRRRLAEHGDVTARVDDRWDRLEDDLAVGFALEASGWKGRAGSAIASDPVMERYYTDIARFAADHGWLRMAWLHVGGRPIAWTLMLEHAGVLYALKGGYATSHRAFGPGQLLILEVVSHCFARGLRRLDFLGSASAYKRVWTETGREMTAIEYFPRSTAGAVGLASYRYGRPVVKRARAYATGEDAAWRRLGARVGTRA